MSKKIIDSLRDFLREIKYKNLKVYKRGKKCLKLCIWQSEKQGKCLYA